MDKKELEKAVVSIKYNLEQNNKDECLIFIQNFIANNKNEIPEYVIDSLLTVFRFILTKEKENANEQIKALLDVVKSDNG